MLYKIVGDTSSGKGMCGHRVKKGESYFIVRVLNELHARCMKCVGKVKLHRTIRIPKDLVDGAIPLK